MKRKKGNEFGINGRRLDSRRGLERRNDKGRAKHEIRCCSSFAKWSKTCSRSGFDGNSITSKSFRGEEERTISSSLCLSQTKETDELVDDAKLETRQ